MTRTYNMSIAKCKLTERIFQFLFCNLAVAPSRRFNLNSVQIINFKI